MPADLTKSAKKSLALIYKAYLERLKSGEAKNSAVHFSKEDKTYGDIVSQALEDAQELSDAGYLKVFIIPGFDLTRDGIIFMENKNKETIKEWLSFFADFIP